MVTEGEVKEVAKWGGIVGATAIAVWGTIQLVNALLTGTTTKPPIETDNTVLIDYTYRSGLGVTATDSRTSLEATFNSGSDVFDPSILDVVRTYVAKGYHLKSITVNGFKFHLSYSDDGALYHDNWHQAILQFAGQQAYFDEFRGAKEEDVNRSATISTSSVIDIYAKVGARSEWHTDHTMTTISSLAITGTIEMSK